MTTIKGILKPTFMDRNRFKHRGSGKDSRSIEDGFIRRSPAPGGNNFKSEKRTSSIKVDDFKRPDGFTPRGRGQNPTTPDPSSLGRRSKNTSDAKSDNIEAMSSKKTRKNKDEKSTRKTRKVFARGFVTLFVAFVFAIGYIVGLTYLRTTQIFEGGESALALDGEIDPALLKGEGDGRVNFLLLGRGGAGHTAPDLTDTIIVGSVDPIQKDAGLVSVPRDTYVSTDYGQMKINAVYATYKDQAVYQGKSKKAAHKEGVAAIEKSVEDVLGINIHYYGMIDFRGFEKAIDVVDGIDIDVKNPVYENMVINGEPYELNVQPGWQHMRGKEALAYSRSRLTSARGDFDRSERQREVIVALRNKVFTLGTFGNPVKISQLIDTFGRHISTNLSIDDLMKLYALAGDIDGSKVKSVGLVDPPRDYLMTSNIDGLSVVVPKAGIGIYDDIHYYIRNVFRDGFLRKESPKVLVLNGTNQPGLALEQKKVLKSYGYKTVLTGDAPDKNYQSNVVVDLTGGEKKYTKRYLELRYHTSATTDLPEGIDTQDADFVIILGQ